MKKVLVLGGGFAGVEAAIFLRKEHFDVTLISERDFFYIYPTSIWVPVHGVELKDISIPLAKLQEVHGFHLIIDEVLSIKAEEKRVICKNNEYSDFDYLVIAIGAGKMKHAGIEHTLSICGKPEDALKIRERIDALITKGGGKIAMGFGGNPKDTSAVRGGPGFELMFNVIHHIKSKGVADKFEFTFFAPMESPGARMGKQALKMMDLFFKKLNIKRHFGKKIKRFESDGVVFEDDSKLESDFTMFIPAGDGHLAIKDSDLPMNEAGFIHINDYCEVEHNFDEIGEKFSIFAIGDCAALEGPDWRAKQGHVAEIMAKNTAYNIAQIERGSEHRKGYAHHLNILCVMDSGDGAAFVFRNDKKAFMLPLPIVGHLLKKAWGWYCKNSKLNKFPRIPGM